MRLILVCGTTKWFRARLIKQMMVAPIQYGRSKRLKLVPEVRMATISELAVMREVNQMVEIKSTRALNRLP